jgi:hypothetical protein
MKIRKHSTGLSLSNHWRSTEITESIPKSVLILIIIASLSKLSYLASKVKMLHDHSKGIQKQLIDDEIKFNIFDKVDLNHSVIKIDFINVESEDEWLNSCEWIPKFSGI